MSALIEVLLLAAASDGNIDKHEQSYILRTLYQTKSLQSFTQQDLAGIQRQLHEKLMRGSTQDDILKAAGFQLDEQKRNVAYALALELCYANINVEEGERRFLKLLRDTWDLDKGAVHSIHLSAELRYGGALPVI